jgi:hypothetical protein
MAHYSVLIGYTVGEADDRLDRLGEMYDAARREFNCTVEATGDNEAESKALDLLYEKMKLIKKAFSYDVYSVERLRT